MDDDTQALLALLGDDSRALLLDIARALTRIEARQKRDVPPQDVRASMAEATEHIADATAHNAQTDAAIPSRDAQINAILDWMHARMSADDLQKQFDEQFFITKQLISIMQGTRDDQVLMRSEVRRLSALLEQTLRARVEDDEAWSGEERRNIADRRKAS